jgi:hypothetical protein
LLCAVAAGWLAGSSVHSSQQSEASGPPVPYEDAGACPFEGCVYREWTANGPVTARAARIRNASIVFTVPRAAKVTALTGVVITVKAGRVRFRQPIDLQVVGRSGSLTATENGSLHVEPGETLFLLTYHGEGFTRAWFKGRVYDEVDGSEFFNGLCDAEPDRCNGQILERPERVWWVQIQNVQGQIGWTDQPERFDGKGALE